MFTLIAKMVDYLVGDDDDDEEDELVRKLPIFEDKSDSLLDKRQFQGKVTHVFNGQGLIDHEIYFSFDDVSNEQKPRVGDLVSVTAGKVKENGGLIATNVMINAASWFDEGKEKGKFDPRPILLPKNSEELKYMTSTVGKITSLNKSVGKINKDIKFDVENDVGEEFRPQVGDWVRAIVRTFDDGSLQAEDVEPLRVDTIEGEVTAVKSDHGYINGEIYFTPNVCLGTFKPKKWDPVKVTAIESDQGKCSWRAVSVAPRTKDARSLSSRSNSASVNIQSENNSWVIPGQRPQFKGGKKMLPVRLEHYTVPDQLRNAVIENEEVTYIVPELIQELHMKNYTHRFSALLHLEEIQDEIDIREFDLHRVCLRKAGDYLALEVPGLAEGRPSVLTGDKIILSDPCDPESPCYEGFVHEVLNHEVWLKFNYEFHSRYNGEDYNVEFTFNRTSLRRCHQALKIAVKQLGPDLLFPVNIKVKSPQIRMEGRTNHMDVVPVKTTYVNSQNQFDGHQRISPKKYANTERVKHLLDSCDGTKDGNIPNGCVQKTTETKVKRYLPNVNLAVQDQIEFINEKLNDCQKLAVIKIVLGQCLPLPYVIFGPPGTGKTITMVESILQILLQIPASRIVACTPSNSAADLLVERLFASGKVKVCDMVRLNSFHRKDEAIPEVVLPFSARGEDINIICRYRIVVCTCNTAGSLVNLGLKVGHFTHAFVDEAGQATEPECLIPLGLVSGADGQIVLAGDPKQLGPVLMSAYAKLYGLELSFLERLMDRSLYRHSEVDFQEFGGFDPELVTMLKENYRSHKAILKLPSELFYFNQLEVKADPSLTHTAVNWSMLPTQGFPVIFHGVRGEDLREGNSPSWFNAAEVVQVVQYLQGILKDASLNIEVEDIGIITPYRKQIEKIRLLIEKLGIERVKVGSVEEFQGQERQVIIISTVRSNERLMGFDVRHVLGFLSNPKRFNVAITRAQAALIVVGNPFVLCQDEKWRMFVEYCVENGGYTGCDKPDFALYDVQDDSLT